MTAAKSFLTDLDDAILRGTAESRMRALWHTTDLMIAGRYSDDEIWTFGEVIGRLADELEVAARAQLAKRLAQFDRAPINITTPKNPIMTPRKRLPVIFSSSVSKWATITVDIGVVAFRIAARPEAM